MASDGTPDYIATGYTALKAGDWAGARPSFEAALNAGADDPEAYDGLGQALWWLNEIEGARHPRGDSGGSTSLPLPLEAQVRQRAMLASEQVFLNANSSAMKGWFARAERLLQGVPPCPEHAWLALLRASMFDSRPQLLPRIR